MPAGTKSGEFVSTISRSYTLPINVDIKSIHYYLLEADHKLRITARKIPPLKMNVAGVTDAHFFNKGHAAFDEIKQRLKELHAGGASQDQLAKELEKSLAEHSHPVLVSTRA